MNIFQLLFESKLAYIATAQGAKLEARALEDTRQQVAAIDVLNKLAAADPTGQQNKYIQWIVNQYIKGQFKLEDVSRIKGELTEFNRVRSNLDKKDINQYKTLPDLYAALEPLADTEVVSNRQSDRDAGQRFFDNGEAILISDSGKVKIIQLASEEASKYFGRGTKWCTAANEDCMFDRYSADGPLYVIIVDGTKYQLHIETGQFMDAKDQQLDKSKMKELINVPEIGALLSKKEQEMGEKYVDVCANASDGDRTAYLTETVQNYINLFLDVSPLTTLAKYVAKDTFYVAWLLDDVETRWPAIEPALLSDLSTRDGMYAATSYAERIIRGVWPEFEKAVLELLNADADLDGDTISSMLGYVRKCKRARWPELEHWLLDRIDTHVNMAIRYAVDVRMARWPEIEEKVLQMPHTAFDYARQVMNDLWPEAEEIIMQGAFTKGPYASWKAEKEKTKK